MTEKELQTKILIALGTMPGMIVWRSAVGNGWVRKGNKFVPMRFGGNVGQADIMACWRGRFVAIEVKTRNGRLRKEQEAWGAAIRACGGIYIVARSIEDVFNGLHSTQASPILDGSVVPTTGTDLIGD